MNWELHTWATVWEVSPLALRGWWENHSDITELQRTRMDPLCKNIGFITRIPLLQGASKNSYSTQKTKKPSFILSGLVGICLIWKLVVTFICEKYVWMLGHDCRLWIQETGKSNIWTFKLKIQIYSGYQELTLRISQLSPLNMKDWTVLFKDLLDFYCAQSSRMTF